MLWSLLSEIYPLFLAAPISKRSTQLQKGVKASLCLAGFG